jgi:bacterioferritin-associated ferredoxin
MHDDVSKGSLTNVIVCQCKVVTDRQVSAAISDGARSVSSVCRATGAASECGSCVFTVKALVCHHQAEENVRLEVEGAAS